MVTIENFSREKFMDIEQNSKAPLLVDFWAEWCQPCKMFSKVFKSVSEKYIGKVIFMKINVDDNREIATQYSISSIPTIVFINGGDIIARNIGTMSEKQLTEFIDENLLTLK